jgi:hypothetical protein
VLNRDDRRPQKHAGDQEINETIQVAASIGAGAILAMADRSHKNADAGYHWWEADAQAGAP